MKIASQYIEIHEQGLPSSHAMSYHALNTNILIQRGDHHSPS